MITDNTLSVTSTQSEAPSISGDGNRVAYFNSRGTIAEGAGAYVVDLASNSRQLVSKKPDGSGFVNTSKVAIDYFGRYLAVGTRSLSQPKIPNIRVRFVTSQSVLSQSKRFR